MNRAHLLLFLLGVLLLLFCFFIFHTYFLFPTLYNRCIFNFVIVIALVLFQLLKTKSQLVLESAKMKRSDAPRTRGVREHGPRLCPLYIKISLFIYKCVEIIFVVSLSHRAIIIFQIEQSPLNTGRRRPADARNIAAVHIAFLVLRTDYLFLLFGTYLAVQVSSAALFIIPGIQNKYSYFF